jgi:transaldolase
MTTVVADTGDLGAVTRLKPVDCTTNPTIVLKAVDTPEYRDVVDEALAGSDRLTIAPALMDALASMRASSSAPWRRPSPRSLRTAEDGICHWFVGEDAVDNKHPDPEGPIDETTFR